MATTGIHSLSMFRNGCLKSPVDPRTGLQASLTDRAKHRNEKSNEDLGQQLDSDQENKEPKSHSQKNSDFLNCSTSSTTAQLIENLTLGDMADDEFYTKLMTLKNEHKKTLAMCEKKYEEKLSEAGFGSNTSLNVGGVDPGPAPTMQTMGRDYGLSNEQPVNTSSDTFNCSLEITGLRKSTEKPPRPPRASRDQVRDMGSKPLLTDQDVQNHTHDQGGSSGRYSLQTAWTEKPSHHSDEYWKRISDSSGDEAQDYDRNRYTEQVMNGYEQDDRRRPQELLSAMTRIDDMWDNFSVEEYAPRYTARSTTRSSLKQRPSSGRASRSLDRRERPGSARRDRSSSLEDSWRHRITIPKPFTMTVREESKPKTTSRTISLYQEEKMKEMQEEDAECQKTFKATPVPAHVYLPLFDEINERAETRRRVNKQVSKEVLKSREMPFKFMKREDTKSHNCHQRTQSAPQKRKKVFKAKPVPKEVYDNTVSERIREEEVYRKIRIKMRSQELQRASSLPPNMAARGSDYVAGKIKSKIGENMYGIGKEPKFQPKIKEKVPNFEKIHRKMQKELMNQKEQKEATVCKPFNLRTNSIERNVDKVVDDMMRDELMLKENRWPYQNARARPRTGSISSLTMDSIPSKLTMSQELRSSANRERIAEFTRKEQEQEERKRRQRAKEKQLKKVIAEKGIIAPEKESPAEKLRKYRESERFRREEYERELVAMKERVDSRPYLFERQSQINARKQAEKRYSATLRSAGVSEEFINKKGSEATDLDFENDDDDYDDDFNSYSYEKSASRQDTVSRDKKDAVHEDEGASDEVEENFDDSFEDEA